MISETGLEMILKDMTQNKTLRTLDVFFNIQDRLVFGQIRFERTQ